jgi:hypothetical protein
VEVVTHPVATRQRPLPGGLELTGDAAMEKLPPSNVLLADEPLGSRFGFDQASRI